MTVYEVRDVRWDDLPAYLADGWTLLYGHDDGRWVRVQRHVPQERA